MIDYICAFINKPNYKLGINLLDGEVSALLHAFMHEAHMRISGSMFRKNKELEDIKCIKTTTTIKWYKVVKVTDRSCFVSLAPLSALAHK